MELGVPIILLQLFEFGDLALISTVLEAIRIMLESGQSLGHQNEIFLEFERNNLSKVLERLLQHPSENIYNKVTSLMETYYNVY